MRNLLLHIGRHKSGTSSLQAWLAAHPAWLREHGVLYPQAARRGVAHHRLAEALSPKALRERPEACQATIDECQAALAAEWAAHPGSRLLLSSEAFQNARPTDVAAVFPGQAAQVLVYLREQADYAVSSYQQVVHAQAHSEDFGPYAERPPVDYARFLDAWAIAFGPEALTVAVYAREALRHQSMVDDALHRLGLPVDTRDEAQAADQNPSIGGALLELKRVVNACVPRAQWPKQLYQAFGQAAASHPALRSKPAMRPDQAERLRASVAASNGEVARRHLGREGPLFVREPEVCHAPPVTLVELAQALLALQAALPGVGRLTASAVLGQPADAAAVVTLLDALRAGQHQGLASAWRALPARLSALTGAAWRWNYAMPDLAD